MNQIHFSVKDFKIVQIDRPGIYPSTDCEVCLATPTKYKLDRYKPQHVSTYGIYHLRNGRTIQPNDENGEKLYTPELCTRGTMCTVGGGGGPSRLKPSKGSFHVSEVMDIGKKEVKICPETEKCSKQDFMQACFFFGVGGENQLLPQSIFWLYSP